MKVLIIGANNIGNGGRSTVAYNISKHIGETKLHSHFLDSNDTNIPNMDKFLDKYRDNLDDDFAKDVSEFDTLAEVKEDIKHPLFEPRKDPYAEIFEDASILSNKGISGAEQLNNMNLSENLSN